MKAKRVQEPVSSFSGDHAFLSNFFLCAVERGGNLYPSVEHAFQAAKATDLAEYLAIRTASSPGEARRLGSACRVRVDWDRARSHVMLRLLRSKFSDPVLRMALLSTGERELIEGNRLGDTYWGVDAKTGVGQNNLGKMLMKVREEVK